ncbi:MAG: cyclic nucleotide-binding domain-containing protein [Actinobacteria bacterium]|nr:cyclic nucleotide-binding domain-containing protein [Actinomycetota bacterium]
MATSEAIDLLSKVPLFSECSPREIEAISRTAKEVSHREGDVLAREGEAGIGFFMILDGTALVEVGGSERASLREGDFFGEISLLDEGPRTATVRAETPVRLLAIPAWTFKGLLEQYPSMAVKMLKVVAGRLRAASEDVTH